MAWINKGNRRYYYESKRVGQRIVSQYIGTGYAALLSEQLTKAARLDAERKRLEWEAIKDEEDRLDKLVEDISAVSQQIVTALMLVTGHHQHKKQWRKKRERSSD